MIHQLFYMRDLMLYIIIPYLNDHEKFQLIDDNILGDHCKRILKKRYQNLDITKGIIDFLYTQDEIDHNPTLNLKYYDNDKHLKTLKRCLDDRNVDLRVSSDWFVNSGKTQHYYFVERYISCGIFKVIIVFPNVDQDERFYVSTIGGDCSVSRDRSMRFFKNLRMMDLDLITLPNALHRLYEN